MFFDRVEQVISPFGCRCKGVHKLLWATSGDTIEFKTKGDYVRVKVVHRTGGPGSYSEELMGGDCDSLDGGPFHFCNGLEDDEDELEDSGLNSLPVAERQLIQEVCSLDGVTGCGINPDGSLTMNYDKPREKGPLNPSTRGGEARLNARVALSKCLYGKRSESSS